MRFVNEILQKKNLKCQRLIYKYKKVFVHLKLFFRMIDKNWKDAFKAEL